MNRFTTMSRALPRPLGTAGVAVVVVALALFARAPAAEPAPVRPLGADGKPLNLDFEDGTHKDWTATGDAFTGQPIKGDTVSPRRGDSKSRHQGTFWIGTYERQGDKLQGTLTSKPFAVTSITAISV